MDNLNDVIKKKCYGFVTNKLSQTDHTCLNLMGKKWLHRYFEDVLLEVNENRYYKYGKYLCLCEEKELVPMYRLKLYCRDWWETDMKTTAWKSKMMRMT